jgi:hypothetical protein
LNIGGDTAPARWRLGGEDVEGVKEVEGVEEVEEVEEVAREERGVVRASSPSAVNKSAPQFLVN